MRIWAFIFLLFALPAFASDRITALVTVTGATSDGQTITVNGNVRTWKTTVTVPATQILIDGTATQSKTNLYNQIGLNPFTSVSILDSTSTAIQLVSSAGVPLTVTLSVGWGTVTYSTQTVATAVAVRVPTSVEVAAQQTNINSALLAAIRASSDTNVWYENDPQMTNFAGLTNNQTIAGIKLLTNVANLFQGLVSNSPSISGKLGKLGTDAGLTNGVHWNGTNVNPISTNGINYGNAFSSPGTGFGAEQFGSGATATGAGGLSVGRLSTASGTGTAIGTGASATGNSSTALGDGASAVNQGDTAIGGSANAAGTNSTALGAFTTVSAGHTNSTAIGKGATTTAANQIMLGGGGINTVVQNALSVGSGATFTDGVTNIIVRGTNSFPVGSDIAFARYALTTLANGINQDIVTGTNVFVEVSGPSGAFSIEGIAGGRDGKFIIILNQTSQNMTIAVEGGATGNDPTAANRILSMTGADRATTGNGAATLIYSAAASRWILISFDP